MTDRRFLIFERYAVHPVLFPIRAGTPVDKGGSDIWEPEPYLKVPNQAPGEDCVLVNRVFCPWGYPPERVRAARRKLYLRVAEVALDEPRPTRREWVLTLEPSDPDQGGQTSD